MKKQYILLACTLMLSYMSYTMEESALAIHPLFHNPYTTNRIMTAAQKFITTVIEKNNARATAGNTEQAYQHANTEINNASGTLAGAIVDAYTSPENVAVAPEAGDAPAPEPAHAPAQVIANAVQIPTLEMPAHAQHDGFLERIRTWILPSNPLPTIRNMAINAPNLETLSAQFDINNPIRIVIAQRVEKQSAIMGRSVGILAGACSIIPTRRYLQKNIRNIFPSRFAHFISKHTSLAVASLTSIVTLTTGLVSYFSVKKIMQRWRWNLDKRCDKHFEQLKALNKPHVTGIRLWEPHVHDTLSRENAFREGTRNRRWLNRMFA